YPKLAPQPINEVELLNGYLEETNKAYSIAKIAGITLCQSFNKQYNTNFISVMPTNLYGLNDNYHPTDSHVIPGLIRRLHEAKLEKRAWVEIWGSGKPMREFLFADDLADACLFLMKTYNSSEIINVGSGEELSILELAHHIKKAVGFQGEIKLNKNMLDGTPRKIIDSSRIHNLGWKHKTDFFEGLKITYQDFKNKLDA
ncbi:MAG: NAD-dependent epimerase/dehydratase family protein, partial [Bdellovibrionales bacterium]|nr:NAD-dependent epimerase/dehydratase family protein [Bdellovibrionales bacterium]